MEVAEEEQQDLSLRMSAGSAVSVVTGPTSANLVVEDVVATVAEGEAAPEDAEADLRKYKIQDL